MIAILSSYFIAGLLPLIWPFGSQQLASTEPLHSRRWACNALPEPDVPGASVVLMKTEEVVSLSSVSYCDVNIILTHGWSKDRVRIQLWMPLNYDDWNGRFQATGGGGLKAGFFEEVLGPAIADHYAAASTDAGLSKEDGSEMADNPQLLLNFASLSVHDMAVVGKALVESFYGHPPVYSYWNGCSTGGRQGMMAAQKYPDDFDGIVAIAPAINFGKLPLADLYPYVVMTEEGEIVPKCVFNTLTTHNIAACDADDGAEDGLISNPDTCEFDAHVVVGQPTNCGHGDTSTSTVTNRQAKIYNLIRAGGPVSEDGVKLWYGLMPGANFTVLGSDPPFDVSSNWIKHILLQDPDIDLSAVTNKMLAKLLHMSQEWFGPILGTDNPDLSEFKENGGKILTWHGLADDCIAPGGTFDYKMRVDETMGGALVVDEFYRVFSAPGVGHCFGGNGPLPLNELDVLVSWVEQGVAPEILQASTMNEQSVVITRNLCRYPLNLKYSGVGNLNEASSWTCA